jgi:hypothetical protein
MGQNYFKLIQYDPISSIPVFLTLIMSSKLPPALIRSLIEHYNIEEEEFISSHESGEQLTSVRINPFKPSNLI